MKLKRHDDWPERLIEYIDAREQNRFEWGKRKQDCCSFALGGVEHITGADIMADVEDWVSADEADLRIAENGGSIEGFVDQHLTRHPAPAFARRGDIGIVINDKGDETLALIEGATAVGPGARRLIRFPIVRIVTAWAV